MKKKEENQSQPRDGHSMASRLTFTAARSAGQKAPEARAARASHGRTGGSSRNELMTQYRENARNRYRNHTSWERYDRMA